MNERLVEIVRCFGIECGKTKGMRISRQQSSVQIMIDQNSRGMWNICTFLGTIKTNDTRCTREIKSRITAAKAVFKKNSLHRQMVALTFEEETSKSPHME
jgi:hypothetical protein